MSGQNCTTFPCAVSFDAQNSTHFANIKQFNWSDNKGNASNEINPTFTYMNSDNIVVTLEATGYGFQIRKETTFFIAPFTGIVRKNAGNENNMGFFVLEQEKHFEIAAGAKNTTSGWHYRIISLDQNLKLFSNNGNEDADFPSNQITNLDINSGESSYYAGIRNLKPVYRYLTDNPVLAKISNALSHQDFLLVNQNDEIMVTGTETNTKPPLEYLKRLNADLAILDTVYFENDKWLPGSSVLETLMPNQYMVLAMEEDFITMHAYIVGLKEGKLSKLGEVSENSYFYNYVQGVAIGSQEIVIAGISQEGPSNKYSLIVLDNSGNVTKEVLRPATDSFTIVNSQNHPILMKNLIGADEFVLCCTTQSPTTGANRVYLSKISKQTLMPIWERFLFFEENPKVSCNARSITLLDDGGFAITGWTESSSMPNEIKKVLFIKTDPLGRVFQ